MNNNICIIGGAGFIGTNLVKCISKENPKIRIVDGDESYFQNIRDLGVRNVEFLVSKFYKDAEFERLVSGCDVVYHMGSTNIPGTSDEEIVGLFEDNVIASARLIEACVRQDVKRVIFISSGGAVYGNSDQYPIQEISETLPISLYGVEKLTIEKFLHLYNYRFGLDYRIIRLSNPYGPFQRPNGRLGVVNTLIYKALTGESVQIYGDGSVVRDYIYIDDAISAIVNVASGNDKEKVYNVGSGTGYSTNEIISNIEKVLEMKLTVNYGAERASDVRKTILNVDRYRKEYGEIVHVGLEEGIFRTAQFMKQYYNI